MDAVAQSAETIVNRWHKLRYGRIVASCECVSGDAAEAMLAPHFPNELIVSDADWRTLHHRRALMRRGVTLTTEQRVANLSRMRA